MEARLENFTRNLTLHSHLTKQAHHAQLLFTNKALQSLGDCKLNKKKNILNLEETIFLLLDLAQKLLPNPFTKSLQIHNYHLCPDSKHNKSL